MGAGALGHLRLPPPLAPATGPEPSGPPPGSPAPVMAAPGRLKRNDMRCHAYIYIYMHSHISMYNVCIYVYIYIYICTYIFICLFRPRHSPISLSGVFEVSDIMATVGTWAWDQHIAKPFCPYSIFMLPRRTRPSFFRLTPSTWDISLCIYIYIDRPYILLLRVELTEICAFLLVGFKCGLPTRKPEFLEERVGPLPPGEGT